MLSVYEFDQFLEQDSSSIDDTDFELNDDLSLFDLAADTDKQVQQANSKRVNAKKPMTDHKLTKGKRHTKFNKKNKSSLKDTKKSKQTHVVTPVSSPVVPTAQQVVVTEVNRELAYERMLARFITRRQPHVNNWETLADFPRGMTHCLNSGDFRGLWDLANMHLERTCDISLSYNRNKLSCHSFVRFFEIMNDIHPDRIMSVHTSEVVDNEVVATVFMKFTDCKVLYESVARNVQDPIFHSFFPNTRAACLKHKMRVDARPDEERTHLSQLLESDNDLVVYGCVQMRLKTNGFSGKGSELYMLCNFSSAHLATVNFD